MDLPDPFGFEDGVETLSAAKIMKYYLWKNEQQVGPYTLDQLKSMWNSGTITTETMYWFEGLTEWIPLGVLVEDAIAEDRRKAQTVNFATADQNQEKPIGAGESVAIILISFLLSAVAFLIGLIYFFTGKRKRGAKLMIWSVVGFVVLSLYFGSIGLPRFAVSDPAPAQHQTVDQTFQNVASDAVAQFEIAKRQGDPMAIYAAAGYVSAAYLAAKDEANYRKWKQIEEEVGIRAGIIQK